MARLSVWMGDENELNTSAGAFSSRPSPRSFDMLGGALLSSGVVGCHRPLLVPRGFSCRVSPCLDCFVLLVRSFLRRLRRICLLSVPLVSPYRRIVRLPARSTSGAGRWRVVSLSWFAPAAVACCLPWLGCGCGEGRCFSRGSCSLPPCRWHRLAARFLSFPLLAVGLSIGLACLARPCCLLRPRCRRGSSWGLIVVGCCRRGSVSSSVVVARRRFALLALGWRRHSCSPRGASAVDRLVDRFTARLLSPSCLSCGGAAGGAGSLSSRCVIRCSGAVLLAPFGSRGGGSSYPSACLPPRYPAVGERWHGGALLLCLRPPWLVRLAFAWWGSPSGLPLLRCLLRCGLSFASLPPHVLAWRCAAVVGVSCLRLAFP